jgi:glutaredoxin
MRTVRRSWVAVAFLFAGFLGACGEKAAGEETSPVVVPPFSVRGDLDGLLLWWVDGEGVHRAESRDGIPDAARGAVRVDSLAVAPSDRLDPAFVYVADLRQAGDDGAYVVRRVPRQEFEATADRPPSDPAADTASEGVVLYGASWCGACRSAARYFREHGVAFVEKDIERDPGARDEMQRKARAAGISTNGIPVIDVHGRIVTGFDPGTLDRLLADHGS